MGLVQLAAFETSLKVAVIADIVLFLGFSRSVGGFLLGKVLNPHCANRIVGGNQSVKSVPERETTKSTLSLPLPLMILTYGAPTSINVVKFSYLARRKRSHVAFSAFCV
jgi:hypothetical protein